MPQWGVDSGTSTDVYVNVYENWNASTQVSMHIRCFIHKHSTGSAVYSSGASWNSNFGGGTNSWSGSYNLPAGANEQTWLEYDATFGKDANGYVTIGCYFYANGNNSPYFYAAAVNQSYSPGRIGVAPTMNNPVASNISVATATISGTNANNGLGTSTTVYLRYKKTAESDASYQQLQTTSWNLTGLTPGTSYTIQIYGNNNNGDTNGWQNTQTFTTLPAPANSTAMLKIIGIL